MADPRVARAGARGAAGEESFPSTCDLWIAGDEIRKGAALDAVQIAEMLFR